MVGGLGQNDLISLTGLAAAAGVAGLPAHDRLSWRRLVWFLLMAAGFQGQKRQVLWSLSLEVAQCLSYHIPGDGAGPGARPRSRCGETDFTF